MFIHPSPQVLTEELLAARAARDSALTLGRRISIGLSSAAAATATAASLWSSPRPPLPSVAAAEPPLPILATPAPSAVETLTTTPSYPPTLTLGNSGGYNPAAPLSQSYIGVDPPSRSYSGAALPSQSFPAAPPSQVSSEDDTEALLSRVRERQRQWRRTSKSAERTLVGPMSFSPPLVPVGTPGGQMPLPPLMPGSPQPQPAPSEAASFIPPARDRYGSDGGSGTAARSFRPASEATHSVTSFHPSSPYTHSDLALEAELMQVSSFRPASSPHRDSALEAELLQVRAAREDLQAALLASEHRATTAAASEHRAAVATAITAASPSWEVRYDNNPTASSVSPRPSALLPAQLLHRLSRSHPNPEDGPVAAASRRSPSLSLSPPPLSSSSHRLTSEQAVALSALAGRPFSTPQAPRSSARRRLSPSMAAPTITSPLGPANRRPSLIPELSALRARLESTTSRASDARPPPQQQSQLGRPSHLPEPLSAIRARLEAQVAMHLSRESEDVSSLSPAVSFASARSR